MAYRLMSVQTPEYHRLNASLAKSLSLPISAITKTDTLTLQLMWNDKKAEKDMKKYSLYAVFSCCLILMVGTFLLTYKIIIHPTITRHESSSNVYPMRNSTLLVEKKYLNNKEYTFSYHQNDKPHPPNADIYGILAFIHYGNNTPRNVEIEYSLIHTNNSYALDTCFEQSKFGKHVPYLVAMCDTQNILSQYALFQLNIDIPDAAYYQLQIYYLLLSTISIHYHYEISPFIEYNNHLYPASRSYYFGMPPKQITDGTYELDFVFNTNCENNTFAVQQCRIGDGDENNVMFPNYFDRSSADKSRFCSSYCEKKKHYHHVMTLNGGVDLMYLQESGFWIVLQYAFNENYFDEYAPFSVELYMDKTANIFHSGEFIAAMSCLGAAICIVFFLICAIKKYRKATKYTAVDRESYKQFYNKRDEILVDIFGKDIVFIIREYLNQLECIQEIKDETVWKGKM